MYLNLLQQFKIFTIYIKDNIQHHHNIIGTNKIHFLCTHETFTKIQSL
jgi:hypothetical protein